MYVDSCFDRGPDDDETTGKAPHPTLHIHTSHLNPLSTPYTPHFTSQPVSHTLHPAAHTSQPALHVHILHLNPLPIPYTSHPALNTPFPTPHSPYPALHIYTSHLNPLPRPCSPPHTPHLPPHISHPEKIIYSHG